METVIMKVSDIRPAEYNPRVELKPGDREYEALKKSLDRFGVAVPLVVNRTTGNLVSGHQRLNVLREQGAEEVEVVVIEADPEREKLLNIAMNKIEGDWDYEKLEAMFEDISPEDIDFTGFTGAELADLFGAEDAGPADDDEEPEEEYDDDGVGGSDDDGEADDERGKPFNIFLSFPSKEAAESWMKERGIEATYTGGTRNVNIRMEGIEYGKGD